MPRRRGLPPHRLGSNAGGARPGAAGPPQERLLVFQGLHDLRRSRTVRPPAPRRLRRRPSEGALVMVHAEGYDAIRFMTERLERQGCTAPYYHAVSRPEIVEREAAHRAISHAELVDVPIMIIHVSGREAMEQIRWAQSRGLKVYAETCPQYITLTEDDLRGTGMDMSGAKYVCSPPPRDRESHAAVWQGIEDGFFQTFSSDHAPFRYDQKGKLHPKGRTSFRWVPNGIPSVETRLPILFSEGVSKGRISVNRFVELASTNHAKIYGLYPRKGSIAVGVHHGPD